MARVLDIEILRTFHAVACLGRFKDAAAHLCKSTSAVSVHIQRLEEIVGTRLFERDNQGVVLSMRGQQLLAESTGLLAEHDRVLSALTKAPVVGKVRLGIPEEYASGFLKRCLPLFAAENPGIELEIEAASSGTLADMFRKSRLDVAVTITVENSSDGGVSLAEIRPVWVVSRDMQALSLAVLPVALHGRGCPYQDAAIVALNEAGRAWRAVITSGNSPAITAAVEGGLAVAVMAKSHTHDTLKNVPASFKLPALPGCVMNLHGRNDSEGAARLAFAVRQYFSAADRH